jgi:hypothetical protein
LRQGLSVGPSEDGRSVALLRRGLGDVRGLRALGALRDLELDLVVLGQALEAVRLNGGKVNKYVRAVVLLDKPKALGVV